jgi:hypothetical protein
LIRFFSVTFLWKFRTRRISSRIYFAITYQSLGHVYLPWF